MAPPRAPGPLSKQGSGSSQVSRGGGGIVGWGGWGHGVLWDTCPLRSTCFTHSPWRYRKAMALAQVSTL